MDVQKTIEFLLENQAAHDERLARIEKAVVVLIEKTIRLDEVMAKLAESLETVSRECEARNRRMDERIELLVSAMGQFMQNRPATS